MLMSGSVSASSTSTMRSWLFHNSAPQKYESNTCRLPSASSACPLLCHDRAKCWINSLGSVRSPVKPVSMIVSVTCFTRELFRRTKGMVTSRFSLTVPSITWRPRHASARTGELRGPDTYQPRLCIWTSCQELAGGGEGIVSHLELSSLNVDCHDPPAAPFFHLRPHSRVVDLLTTLCELFLAVTRPSYCHAVTPFFDVESDPGLCNPSMLWS